MDTLDQIREHLEAINTPVSYRPDQDAETIEVILGDAICDAQEHAIAALAKFDALLAEGWVDDPYQGDAQGGPVLCIPLLVWVGCGNAKKDTP